MNPDEQQATLYLLINSRENPIFYSPFGWRAQLALKQKSVDFKEEGLEFHALNSKIKEITEGRWKQIPTLVLPNQEVIYDSRKIALALEQRYPNKPKLFPNGPYFSQFLEHYIQSNKETFFGLLIKRQAQLLDPISRPSIEKLIEPLLPTYPTQEVLYSKMRCMLAPIFGSLKENKFLEGEEPSYSDYIVFSELQWLRVLTPDHFKALIEDSQDQHVFNWFQSILNLYDGYAKSFRVAAE